MEEFDKHVLATSETLSSIHDMEDKPRKSKHKSFKESDIDEKISEESQTSTKDANPKQKKRMQGFLFFWLESSISPWQILMGPGPVDVSVSSLTHISYLLISSFIFLCHLVMSIPTIRHYVGSDANLCRWTENKLICEDIVGYLTINRFGFAISSLPLLLMVVFCVKSCNYSTMMTLHTGFWLPKVFLILIMAIIALSIPPSVLDRIWSYVTMSGTYALCILSYFLVMDFSMDIGLLFRRNRNYFHGNPKLWNMANIALISALTIIISLYISSFILGLLFFSTCRGHFVIFYVDAFLSLVSIMISSVGKDKDIRLIQAVFVSCYSLHFSYVAFLYQGYNCSSLKDKDNHPADSTIHFMGSSIILLTIASYGLLREPRNWHHSYGQHHISGMPVDQDIQSPNHRRRLWEDGYGGDAGKIDSSSQPQRKNTGQSTAKRSNDDLMTPKSSSAHRAALDASPQHPLNVYEPSLSCLLCLLITFQFVPNLTGWELMETKDDSYMVERSIFPAICLTAIAPTILILLVWNVGSQYMNLHLNNTHIFQNLKRLGSAIYDLFQLCCFHHIKFKMANRVARCLYFAIFSVIFLLSCISLFPEIKKLLGRSSYHCTKWSSSGVCLSNDPSLLAISRLSFALALFFLILYVVSLFLTTKSFLKYQNIFHFSCWPIKLLLLLFIFIVSLQFSLTFSKIWIYVSLSAMFLFIIIKLACILDITSLVIENTSDKHSKGSQKMFVGCSSLVVFLYLTTLAVIVCFYVYFAETPTCKTNRLFISINLILCLVASMVSIHPIAQNGGLLRSAIVTSFCTYLTWSALNFNPKEQCNPLAHDMFLWEATPSKSLLVAIDLASSLLILMYITIRSGTSSKLFQFSTLFKCDCSKGNKRCLAITGFMNAPQSPLDFSAGGVLFGKNPSFPKSECNSDNGRNVKKTAGTRGMPLDHAEAMHLDDMSDAKKSKYFLYNSYDGNLSEEDSFKNGEENFGCISPSFYMIYTVASLHCILLLTHWLQPLPGSHFQMQNHWAMMCIQMVACSFGILFYIWTQLSYIIFKSYNTNE